MIRSRFLKRIARPGCWKFLGLSMLVGALAACKPESPVATIVVVNKKMPLMEWPDSLYIADLDSILALEPLKKQDKDKPSIAMNTFKAPNFILPSSVTGKKTEKETRANQGTRTDSGKSGQASPQSSKNHSAENFANQFTQALSALQSDPSNSKLYKVVESKDGEDLFQLLRRTYGAGAQSLPRFYVLSTLQSVNPGVVLEHLNAGDKVRVPKL